MVQAMGAIKANCLDSTDLLTYMYVHNEMQVEVMIKSQMTLIDDAVFFSSSKPSKGKVINYLRNCFFRPASL